MAQTMKLKLNAPGMTSLHKAGLAGLYMTLKAFEKNQEKIEGLEWELADKEITLHWTEDKPKTAFTELIKRSFGIDNGFIKLYAFGSMSPEKSHLLYEALLNCFLQYGKHREKKGKTNLSYEIDDKTIWIKDFEPINSFVHQNVAKDWLDTNGSFKPNIEIIGWLYPGGSQRHVVHKATFLSEPFDLALTLLFAPVGVIYYLVRSKAKGRKSRLALLIPEIKNLAVYFEVRRVIASQGVFDLTASSSTDAALKMLIALETNASTNQFARLFRGEFLCRVITFGIVAWNEKQKSRTALKTIISGRLSGFENYHLANTIFKNRWQQVQEKRNRQDQITEPEHFFVTTFCARELIADNVANNKAWYHSISEYLANRDTREQIYYEGKELGQMVKDSNYENENERLFVEACHESWRRRMGKLGQRATSEGTSFGNLANKEREKFRTSLGRCKNAESLRETVVDFWSRAGSVEQLQDGGLAKILPLFDEKNWRKAKDLALLALVSYQAPEESNDEN